MSRTSCGRWALRSFVSSYRPERCMSGAPIASHSLRRWPSFSGADVIMLTAVLRT